MSKFTKEDYHRAAEQLWADYKWKGAYWDRAKVLRYVRAAHRAAVNPAKAPKYLINWMSRP